MAIETVISSLLLFMISMVALGGNRRAYLQISIAIISFAVFVYLKVYQPLDGVINYYAGAAVIAFCFLTVTIKVFVEVRGNMRSDSGSM